MIQKLWDLLNNPQICIINKVRKYSKVKKVKLVNTISGNIFEIASVFHRNKNRGFIFYYEESTQNIFPQTNHHEI